MKFIQKTKDNKEITYVFKNKAEREQYIFICEEIWGGVPVDVVWAMGTNPYKNKLTKL